ncbi:ABC-three component system protein [uncultured Lacinutrix sp.]|uniref:ABC-three component system protein n=1 Tax=uncultured Lacinutrix sp. TaxID=574032 RepID=UPI002623FE65|nr:ABC-three component system protein [uncultured Lacinutrix sp.]
MSNTVTDFSAKEPALGYFYQFLYSLFRLIKSKNTEASIRIECLDDIDIIDDSLDLIQTKLHIKSVANLSNSSPDFWKSLRVWADNIEKERIDLDNTTFTLVTTANISESSFLNYFSETKNKNETLFTESEILDKLISVAENSTSATNKKGYELFLSLPKENQLKLINNISIIDASMCVDDLLEEIKHELRFTVFTDKLPQLTDRVIGNWMVFGVKHLTNRIPEITYKQLHSIILDISNSFKEENLPNDFLDEIKVTDEEAKSLGTKTFIKQLELISFKTTSRLVKNAISDFRRAYEQRSRWIREQLININEEEAYEKELVDKWNSLFAVLEDKCDGIKDDEELKNLSKVFYTSLFVEKPPSIYIKKNFTSEYLIRGSYHILSDKKIIGWHPKFEDLL